MTTSKKKNAPLDLPEQEMPLAPPNPSITVKGGTLRSIFCDYSYDHKLNEHTVNGVSIDSEVPAHDDLKNAFKKLAPHLPMILEMIDANEVPDIDTIPQMLDDRKDEDQDPLALKFSKFTVYDFMVTGQGDNEGVTIKGHKRLSTGEEVKLTTPKTKWYSEYPFVNELRVVVNDICEEIDLYIRGKQAPRMVQTEMFAEAEQEENA